MQHCKNIQMLKSPMPHELIWLIIRRHYRDFAKLLARKDPKSLQPNAYYAAIVRHRWQTIIIIYQSGATTAILNVGQNAF